MYLLINNLEDYLRKQYESRLLSENLPKTTSGEIKRTCASKPAEWVSAARKEIAGKSVERPFNKRRIKTHLMTQKMVSYGICDLDCPDLMNDFEDSVYCECETGSTN
jgi:hypothetical protein